MDNFDLRKYLAEGRLLKEDVMVNPIIMFGGKKYIEDVISSPDDFGFDKDDAEWVKNNILSSPKMVSIQDYMDLDDKWVKQAQIETGGGGDLDHIVDALKVHIKQGLITPEQAKEAMKVVGLAEGKLYETPIPSGWKKIDTSNDYEEEERQGRLMGFEAPMSGIEGDEVDNIYIEQDGDEYEVHVMTAFNNPEYEGPFSSKEEALKVAIQKMEDLKKDWDE
jgi:hypothetical protein